MKKWMIPLLALCSLALLGGCGENAAADNTATDTQKKEAYTAVEGQAIEGEETEASESSTPVTECVPSVMIKGTLYQDTGYISSAVGCGTMDGEITSTVDRAELPTRDGQSNFGTGYKYQISSKGQMIVVVDANWKIFRDSKHSFTSDIPVEVLNFRAKVVEDRGKGNYLVSVIDVPDMFAFPAEKAYVILTNEKNLKEEIAVGDTVRVWFDSLVQEIYPPILPNVYRVVKEEQEPAEPEPPSENNDTSVKLGAITPGCLYILKGGPVISSVALTGNIAGSESFNSKQTAAGGIRDIFELNEWIDVYLTTRATDGVQVFVFKNTDVADEYNDYNYAGELQNLVASADLSRPENEGDSWGSFYLNPEDAEPGYYDLVFACDGIPAGVMKVKIYAEKELEGKTDAELYDIMGSVR